MFGHAVTTYGQFNAGNYGYIVAVDLSKIYAKEITSVQIIDTAEAHLSSDPITDIYSIEELQNFINDENCPDIAFAISSDIFYLFLKTTLYPYANTTRFTLYGKRHSKPITALTDNLDIRESELELFVNYAMEKAALITNKRLDPLISRNIQILESKL